jgi:hypothetical protein
LGISDAARLPGMAEWAHAHEVEYSDKDDASPSRYVGADPEQYDSESEDLQEVGEEGDEILQRLHDAHNRAARYQEELSYIEQELEDRHSKVTVLSKDNSRLQVRRSIAIRDLCIIFL